MRCSTTRAPRDARGSGLMSRIARLAGSQYGYTAPTSIGSRIVVISEQHPNFHARPSRGICAERAEMLPLPSRLVTFRDDHFLGNPRCSPDMGRGRVPSTANGRRHARGEWTLDRARPCRARPLRLHMLLWRWVLVYSIFAGSVARTEKHVLVRCY